ncbi:hypothetical protein QWY22_11500 [Planococcus liqunii]|uniref:Uncharacterized protein n=1 Tax=Planococcus liqunii TaxID=3058394 RepID=A0ABT8MLG6_9BACL|nr:MULTISPECIES: hypothetical protein [unclassified Planococcus (in: firmicutes)]MDN7225732.1 hypothetical protein [Planococcus sp. N064]WKA49528.1 hypothetical protein QWY22_11500 [Planococcus sp. N056]
MDTVQDVEIYLLSKKSNLTARRWAKNKRLKQRILEKHLTWNGDHLKINRIDMLKPLHSNIDYYLDHPSLIDDQFRDEASQA